MTTAELLLRALTSPLSPSADPISSNLRSLADYYLRYLHREALLDASDSLAPEQVAPASISISDDRPAATFEEFRRIYRDTAVYDLANNFGLIDRSYCSTLTPLLAFELSSQSIPYRHIERRLPDHLARLNPEHSMYHTHLRVPIVERGSTVWKIIDPTIGQFFRDDDGAPMPGGAFFGQTDSLPIYTYEELVTVYSENLDKLGPLAARVDSMIGNYNGRFVWNGTHFQRNPLESRLDQARALVEVIYGPENAIGDYKATQDPQSWKPDNALDRERREQISNAHRQWDNAGN